MELTIFWAPWCNLSIEVLTRLNGFVDRENTLKASLKLVAPFKEKTVMPLVESQNWAHLHIVCDPERELYSARTSDFQCRSRWHPS